LSGGVIASQASASRWLRKVPPPEPGTGISTFARTAAKSIDGRIEVATRKPVLVAPVGIGKKPVGKAVVCALALTTRTSEPDGAADASRMVPAEAAPLSR